MAMCLDENLWLRIHSRRMQTSRGEAMAMAELRKKVYRKHVQSQICLGERRPLQIHSLQIALHHPDLQNRWAGIDWTLRQSLLKNRQHSCCSEV